jgi:hypothetical protein
MFIRYIENFLTKEECKSIIDLGVSTGLVKMKSSKIINGKLIKEDFDYEGNKRTGCYFVNDLLETPLLKSLSKKVINLSNDLNPFNNITYSEIPKYSFNRYVEGDFLDWHSDNHEILNGATITFIIQLNDNYENGDIKYIINDIEYTVNKKVGSVFIFDSNVRHSVDKITGGDRYSINVWPTKTIKKSLI